MRKGFIFWFSALILWCVCCGADDVTKKGAVQQKAKDVFLLCVHDELDADLVSGVRNALELDLLVPYAVCVSNVPHQTSVSPTDVNTETGRCWLGCLVLLSDDGGRAPTDSVLVTNFCGMVYVGALKKGLGSSSQDQALFRKRVQKESVKAAALALGLAPCPFPRCALSTPDTEEGLDAKGVNLCPPCYVQKQQLLLKAGLLPTCER